MEPQKMAHDLSLAQNHAFNLARTLMIPVVLFQTGSEYGVMPAEELEGDEVVILFEYDPYEGARAVH